MYNPTQQTFESDRRSEYITAQTDGVLGGAILQEFDRIMNADPLAEAIPQPVDGFNSLQREQPKAEYIPPDHDCTRCSVNAATCTLLEMANTNSVFADRIQAVSDIKKNGGDVSNEAIKQRMEELRVEREVAVEKPVSLSEKPAIPTHIAEMMKKRAQVVKVEPIAKPVEVIAPPKIETVLVVPIDIHVPNVEVVVSENQKLQPVYVETIHPSPVSEPKPVEERIETPVIEINPPIKTNGEEQQAAIHQPIIETVSPVIHEKMPQTQESHVTSQEILISAADFSKEPRQTFEVQVNPPYQEKFQPDQPERNIDVQVHQAESILKIAIAEPEKPRQSDITKNEPSFSSEQISEQVIQIPVKKEVDVGQVVVENTTIFTYEPQLVAQERREVMVEEPSSTQSEKLETANIEIQNEPVEKNNEHLVIEVSETRDDKPYIEKEEVVEAEEGSEVINLEVNVVMSDDSRKDMEDQTADTNTVIQVESAVQNIESDLFCTENPLVSFIDAKAQEVASVETQKIQSEALPLDYMFDETSFEDVTLKIHEEHEIGREVHIEMLFDLAASPIIEMVKSVDENHDVGEDLSWLPAIESFYEEENILVASDAIVNPILEIAAFYENPDLGAEVSERELPVFEIDFSQVVIPPELTREPVVRDSSVEEFNVEEHDGVIDEIEDSVIKQLVEDVKEFFEKSVDDSNVFESDPMGEPEREEKDGEGLIINSEENSHILEIKKVLTELLWCVEIITLLGNKTVRREITNEMAGNNSLLYKYMLQNASEEEMKKDPHGNASFIPDENVNFLLFFWVVSTGLRKVFSFSSVKKNIISS